MLQQIIQQRMRKKDNWKKVLVEYLNVRLQNTMVDQIYLKM
jgi:hypothetical protein